MIQIDSFDTNTILDVKDLDKSFGDVHAVNSISFKVKKGELFAFLGVNGVLVSPLPFLLFVVF